MCTRHVSIRSVNLRPHPCREACNRDMVVVASSRVILYFAKMRVYCVARGPRERSFVSLWPESGPRRESRAKVLQREVHTANLKIAATARSEKRDQRGASGEGESCETSTAHGDIITSFTVVPLAWTQRASRKTYPLTSPHNPLPIYISFPIVLRLLRIPFDVFFSFSLSFLSDFSLSFFCNSRRFPCAKVCIFFSSRLAPPW